MHLSAQAPALDFALIDITLSAIVMGRR